MAMGHERSKPLHNFTLPCGLKWGKQRYLRCAKVDSNGSHSIGRPEINRRRSNGGGGSGDGIAAVREKLMFDLQEETDKMKEAIFRDKEVYPTPAPPSTAAPSAEDASRPWNLRTRRAACKAPMNGIIAGGSSPVSIDQNKSPRLRSEFAGAGDSCTGGKKRATFSVLLCRKEIEEDFVAMVGHRPPRKPKKRAKLVQKNLDTLFPGLWLTEITSDLYKVPDDQ